MKYFLVGVGIKTYLATHVKQRRATKRLQSGQNRNYAFRPEHDPHRDGKSRDPEFRFQEDGAGSKADTPILEFISF